MKGQSHEEQANRRNRVVAVAAFCIFVAMCVLKSMSLVLLILGLALIAGPIAPLLAVIAVEAESRIFGGIRVRTPYFAVASLLLCMAVGIWELVRFFVMHMA